MNGCEEVGIRSKSDQLMIEVPDGGFGVMEMSLHRKNDVCLAFFLAVEQHADLGELRFQLLQLGWCQLYLPACIGDLHGSDPYFIYTARSRKPAGSNR